VNAFDATLGGASDAFVTMLSPAGDALVYSTYFGGQGSDGGSSIAVDASGAAYVAGSTTSNDFPTQNAFDDTANWRVNSKPRNRRDGFVAKLAQ
jgi:hypothetical protein